MSAEAPRWIVSRKFQPGLGWVAEILDTRGRRRILVAGDQAMRRAEARASQLNSGGAERSPRPRR
jgi:hypothetical protein